MPTARPATLTAPPDGQTLENVIGELQSEWGVPQYPQEYRITLKVADERERRQARAPEGPAEEPAPAPAEDGAPRREKAPGMHNVATEGGPKRKRGRRRRRRGRGRAGEGSGGPAP